jgi:hypothetical protein
MVEVICGERASGPGALLRTARPGAQVLRLTASARPREPAHLAESAPGVG